MFSSKYPTDECTSSTPIGVAKIIFTLMQHGARHAGCALKAVQGAAGKGICVPASSQAGTLTARLAKQFQTCWASTQDWNEQCQQDVRAFFALTGCERTCFSEYQRGRGALCWQSTNTECQGTLTKACDNIQNSENDHSALPDTSIRTHCARM